MHRVSNGRAVHFQEAIKAATERGVVLPDVYYGKLQGIARQLSFSIAGVAKFDQLQAVKDSLDKALASGQTFAQWQKQQAVQDLNLPKYRLDNIFRTNIQSQYMAGHWEQFERNKAYRPYLMYDAINDSRTRPTHLAMDGIIRPIDDSFWKKHSPPCGYRCRCHLISLTKEQALARSKDGKGLNMPIDEQKMQPDKDWDYSPRERLQGIEQAVAKRLENPVASTVIKSAFENLLANNEMIIYENVLSEVKTAINSTAFQEFYANAEIVGNFKVGVLSELEKTLLATEANFVLMSKESLEHHKKKHPEITLADYKKLPEIIANGEIYETQERRYVLLKIDGKTYRAAMKVTQNKTEVYLLSLVAQSNKKADKEIRAKFKRIK